MAVEPHFSVDGERDPELDRDLTELMVEAMRYRQPTLRATFSTAQSIAVGKAIQVKFATVTRETTVFDGHVSAVEFVFDENAPPSVVVSATHASQTQPTTSAASIVLARGNELVSANVRVQKSRAFVTVVGVTSGSPDIVVGSVLRLERIGASFSGDGYEVTRITHSFDDHGFASTFEAQRPV